MDSFIIYKPRCRSAGKEEADAAPNRPRPVPARSRTIRILYNNKCSVLYECTWVDGTEIKETLPHYRKNHIITARTCVR